MYLYLALNILCFGIPLACSFYTKAPFYKKWKYLWISTLAPGVVFVAWDMTYTDIGVWGFNERYLTGLYVYNLPLEEVLFFICLPYASVFTYFALIHLFPKDYLFPHQELISSAISIFAMIMGIYHMDRWYTGVTFFGLGIFLAYQMIVLRPRYMGRFYFAFAFLLIPFFAINSLLTGAFMQEPVVWYNNEENLGIRLGTVPIEDMFYGMLLIIANITIFEHLRIRKEGYYYQ